MPRPKGSVKEPSYRLHQATGQARMLVNGRTIYLGKFGSPESHEARRRILAEWYSRGKQAPSTSTTMTVAEVLAAFMEHAKQFYRSSDGGIRFRPPVRLVLRLYGSTPALKFERFQLAAVRDEMLRQRSWRRRQPWTRPTVNRYVSNIVQIFAWAAEQGLIPASVPAGLKLKPLLPQRTTAPENRKVGPVPEEYIDAVLECVTPTLAAMIRVQLLTGMRPGEVAQMRTCDIDMAGGCGNWIYRPQRHKTSYKGFSREVIIGPRAQEIIRPMLSTDLAAPVFRPTENRKGQRAMVPPSPAEMAAQAAYVRSGGNFSAAARELGRLRESVMRSVKRLREKLDPTARGELALYRPRKRPVPAFFTTMGYRQFIKFACDHADRIAHARRPDVPADERLIPRWHPNRLRHNYATTVRRTADLEAARILLGHHSQEITLIYAEPDIDRANKVVAKIG